MKTDCKFGRAISVTFAAALCSLILLSGCQGRFDKDDDDRRPQASPTAAPAAQISFENGEVSLTFDEQAQKRLGIELRSLANSSIRKQVEAPATILPAQDLAAFRNNYVAAQSQLEKDRLSIDVARKEFTRAKSLFDGDQSVSAKSLESTEANLRSLEADERAALQQLTLQGAIAEQQWGAVIAKWATDGSPEMDRVLASHELLVQATLPFDGSYGAPKSVVIELPGRASCEGTLISAFPRVDSRIQGRNFLYVVPAQPDFAPGVNLVAHIPVGDSMHGVVVPASAIVWSGDKAWAYVQTAAHQFSRRQVPTDSPVDVGYFVSKSFTPEAKVVTQGAQALLSEESLLQGYGGAGGDQDDN